MSGRVERDAHGMAALVELSGLRIECRPDHYRHPGSPWVLSLTDGRRMRLGTLELDKIMVAIRMLHQADEHQRKGRESI